MAAGDRGDQLLVDDPLEDEVVGVGGRADDADVEAPGLQTLDLRSDAELAEGQIDVGARGAELPDGERHDRAGGGLQEPDREAADLAARRAPRRLDPGLDLVDRALGIPAERCAGGSDPDLTPVAMEELGPDLGLEPLDLLADRGLGDVDAVRRPAEVELVGDGQEVPQVAELDTHKVEILQTAQLYIGHYEMANLSWLVDGTRVSSSRVLNGAPGTASPRCPVEAADATTDKERRDG